MFTTLSIHGFCLWKCPWKTIQQLVTLGAIFQFVEGQSNHDIICDELPLINESLGQHSGIYALQHVLAEQDPTGEVLHLEVFGDIISHPCQSPRPPMITMHSSLPNNAPMVRNGGPSFPPAGLQPALPSHRLHSPRGLLCKFINVSLEIKVKL